MIPIVSITIVPALIILAVAYPLRPQGGRMLSHSVPAREIIARLGGEEARPSQFGSNGTRSSFTVPARRNLWLGDSE